MSSNWSPSSFLKFLKFFLHFFRMRFFFDFGNLNWIGVVNTLSITPLIVFSIPCRIRFIAGDLSNSSNLNRISVAVIGSLPIYSPGDVAPKANEPLATVIPTPKFRPRIGPIGEYDYPLLLGDRRSNHLKECNWGPSPASPIQRFFFFLDPEFTSVTPFHVSSLNTLLRLRIISALSSKLVSNGSSFGSGHPILEAPA